MKRLPPAAVLFAVLAGACSSGGPLAPPPSVVTFELRNDGSSPVYLRQDCLLNYTITSLADPARTIVRQGPCACDCALATCPVCGACFQGPREVAAGAFLEDAWLTVNVTHEPRATGSCERKHTLPAGPYRIDVPVYPTLGDAENGSGARTAAQSFELPGPDGNIVVALGVSP